MVICKICNREFKSLLSLTFHLKSKEHDTTPKEYYDKYLKRDGEGICHSCGKETRFRNINLGYRAYCSSFCSNNCEERIQKIKQTNLERYGCENVFQSSNVKEKIKQTCLERYGVEHHLQNEDILKKQSETNLERYGVEHPLQSREILEHTKQTNLERYGYDYGLQSPLIKEKCKKTRHERYGYSTSFGEFVCVPKGSNKKSKDEAYFAAKLEELKINYIFNYSEVRYPFNCDFYLPDNDLFVELNLHWFHNKHFFDKNNKEDLDELQKYQKLSQTNRAYKSLIDVWTNGDLRKKQFADYYKLNYVVLWHNHDVDKFLEQFNTLH